MCGINGSFAYHPAAGPVDRAQLERVRERMAARGPDGCGLWIDAAQRIGLGHRRLAIIDLDDRALQPMCDARTGSALVFNGEIYNYRQLREELHGAGVPLHTESDTEVILLGFRHWGWLPLLARLRGMYAIALYDADRRRLHLARDPYGIKPLYLADDGWTVHFASSVRALEAVRGIDLDIEPAAETGFLLWGSVPEPFTWRRGIRCLPAGHQLIIDAGGLPQSRAHTTLLAAWTLPDLQLPAAEACAQVRTAVVDSVRAHLVADVPVGAFLSAGRDSTTLVGVMHDLGVADVRTVTLGFSEFAGSADDETPLAAAVAARYGTRHAEQEIDRRQFEALLPALLDSMDQPSIDGFNTWLVSRAAVQSGLKVALSGVGGDELFAGYDSFRSVPRWRWLAPLSALPGLSPLLRRAAGAVAQLLNLPPKAPAVLAFSHFWAGRYLLKRGLFLPWELPRLLPLERVRDGLHRLNWRTLAASPLHAAEHLPDLCKVSLLESSLYLRNQLLRDTDWAAMAHGLEVRTPLVDIQLLRTLAPLQPRFAGGVGKDWLAQAPRSALPAAIRQRPKSGFLTPVGHWLRSGTQLDGWRRHAWLAHPRQHWSRRLAVAVHAHFSAL